MKNWIVWVVVALLLTACSKQEETGREITGRLRAPIEETKAITDKIQKTREISLPE